MVKKTVASAETHNFVYQVMEKYHPELAEHGITVTVFMAEKVDKEGNSTKEPAIIVRGQACSAEIRKANQRELGLGSGLLIIEVDALEWDNMPEKTRIALMDHELCHFVLKKEKKTGMVKLDGNDKPMLQGVHHDREIGIFYDVIRRHRIISPDYMNVISVHTEALSVASERLSLSEE